MYGDLPPGAVHLLVLRRVAEEIAQLHVGGHLLVNRLQLDIACREEHPPACFVREPLQQALAPERDTRDAADAYHVHRRAALLNGPQHVLEWHGAVFVVAVGNEHNRVPPVHPGNHARRVLQGVEDSRAAARSNPPDGIRHRLPVVGRPCDRAQRFRERHDDDPVLRAQVTGERGRGLAHELDAAAHARTAVDQKRVRGGHRLGADHVQHLRHAVLEHGEPGGGDVRDEPPEPILDGRFEHHARHFRLLEDLEGFQEHHVTRAMAKRVGHLRGNLTGSKRVLVGPLESPRRTVSYLPEQHVIHEDADGVQGGAGIRLHLRDDPHGSRNAGTA